jgi:hypothetical protein
MYLLAVFRCVVAGACVLYAVPTTTVSAATAPPAEAELPSPEVPAPPTTQEQQKTTKDTKEVASTPPVRNLAAGEAISTATQDTGVSSPVDSLDPGYGRCWCM